MGVQPESPRVQFWPKSESASNGWSTPALYNIMCHSHMSRHMKGAFSGIFCEQWDRTALCTSLCTPSRKSRSYRLTLG